MSKNGQTNDQILFIYVLQKPQSEIQEMNTDFHLICSNFSVKN